MSLKSLKSLFARIFGLKAEQNNVEVPVEGHNFRVTLLRPFKGHSTVHVGWMNGTPGEIALALVNDGTALPGEYITIGGQRWRAWAGAVTPVDPARRQFSGDRGRHREKVGNPCQSR